MGNCRILDSACSSTVCGKKWLNGYIDSLGKSDLRKQQQQTGSRRTLVFVGGNQLRSDGEFWLPAEIAGKEVSIKTDGVQSDIPLFHSPRSVMKAGPRKRHSHHIQERSNKSKRKNFECEIDKQVKNVK